MDGLSGMEYSVLFSVPEVSYTGQCYCGAFRGYLAERFPLMSDGNVR